MHCQMTLGSKAISPMNLLGNARYSPHSLLTLAYIGGNTRRQPRDTEDEDEALYQCQNYQQSQQLYQACWKTRIGIEGNHFPNPRT
jgi:hypothetical protein